MYGLKLAAARQAVPFSKTYLPQTVKAVLIQTKGTASAVPH